MYLSDLSIKGCFGEIDHGDWFLCFVTMPCRMNYDARCLFQALCIYDVCSYNTQRLQRKNPLWGDDDESVAVSSFIIEIKPRKLPFNFPGCSLLSNSLNWLIINYVPLKTWHKHHRDRLFNHYNYITFFPLAPNPNPLL